MTRINIGIRPAQLTDEHLRAEYREIQRLPSNYRAAVRSGSINQLPKQFTLGKGHVLFFMDKFNYVAHRYDKLHFEMLRRTFKVVEAFLMRTPIWQFVMEEDSLPIEHFGKYEPTSHDRQLLIERITQRITESPKKYWHYYGKRITPEEAINLLNL